MHDDTPTPQAHSTDLRSYGRRRGRRHSPRQERLLAELLPKVRVELPVCFPPREGDGQTAHAKRIIAPHPDPLPVLGRPAARPTGTGDARDESAPSEPTRERNAFGLTGLPPGVTGDTWLEIGFGGGEHLVWQAQNNPHVRLIGCEPFEDGVVKVLAAIEDRKLANIRIHPDDARPLLRALPEASLSRAFILFPDPWPKKRHAKRRLVSRETLALLARALRPGAELRIATDIGDYARSTLVAMQGSPQFRWIAEGPSDWRERPADWPPTRYEAKALAAGRKCSYLRFCRVRGAETRE